jgi:hypothetical protein
MALSILDGNQSATTLSTIVTSGQHIPAHTVVSLGTQAISNITSAVSGTTVTFGLVGGTVTANNFTLTNVLQYDGSHYFLKVGGVATTGGTSFPVYVAGSVTANPTGTQTIAGTVTAGNLPIYLKDDFLADESLVGAVVFNVNGRNAFGASGVTVGSIPPLPAGTNNIGTVTANTFAVQGTAVTTSNFTSTTPSTILASFNATREVLTIFNEGAGNLHICAGATCTTIAYQVRLSAGDYYEVPNHQTTITHSAVFATAGTARVTEVS